MALLDAWALAASLDGAGSVQEALARTLAMRGGHVRLYQWRRAQRGLGTFVREEVPVPSRVHEQRLVWLCREFVESVSKEGFTLREVRRALAALAKPRGR